MWRIVDLHYESLDGNWLIKVDDIRRIYYLIGYDTTYVLYSSDLFSALDEATAIVDRHHSVC